MMTEKITSNQHKQIIRFIEDGIDAMTLEKDGAQRLIENGGEFQVELKKLIECFSLANQYEDEQVGSSYGYLSGYKPKGIIEQINRLHELFPGIGHANERLAEGALPENAEGWFAIPRWERVATTYVGAVEKVLKLLKQIKRGGFVNYKGSLCSSHLRQSRKSIEMFRRIGEEQGHYGILVIPAQFGIRYRGYSVRRAREVMNANECGLGAFAIGIMLLTHPMRLTNHDDLWIDCAGDEFSLYKDEDFSESPYFEFSNNSVGFDAGIVSCADESYGSASMYFPRG